jgi:hypothetical protein
MNVNDELGRIWKVTMIYFKVLWNGWNEENHRNLSQMTGLQLRFNLYSAWLF